MSRYTLTALDTTQIQSYVFGSNQLKENVGGSELVELATHQWVYEALPPNHNVKDFKLGTLDLQKTIDVADAEIVYTGGGNTVILFKTLDLAREFSRRLTRRLLVDAPGLELVVAHKEFDWNLSALADVVQKVLGIDLARKKQVREPSLPLLGLGVAQQCSSTGLVATGVIDQTPVSREIQAKLAQETQQLGERRLHDLLPRITQGGWAIPRDFDKLGRIKREEGYIAVVHADGNGMGKRVEEIAARHAGASQNRAYIEAMRAFSAAIEEASKRAIKSVGDLLADALVRDPEMAKIHEADFPMRPIVFGGDDVTFVCNGRYGLPLAIAYLEAFETETAKEAAFDGRPVCACAGIAVVKVHYPFARAYRLSEQLCRSAKRFAREMAARGKRECSALDWHFAMSGITGSLKSIRELEYEVDLGERPPGSLVMRPILLREHPHTWRSWSMFETITRTLAEEDGEWHDRRNKVKALREALRAPRDPNHEVVREFLRTYRLDALPEADNIPVTGVAQTGWAGTERCVYFDPIEAMDFYTDLKISATDPEEDPIYAEL